MGRKRWLANFSAIERCHGVIIESVVNITYLSFAEPRPLRAYSQSLVLESHSEVPSYTMPPWLPHRAANACSYVSQHNRICLESPGTKTRPSGLPPPSRHRAHLDLSLDGSAFSRPYTPHCQIQSCSNQ